MDFLSDNFIANFFTNPKKTDKEFNQFINVKFTQYLNNTNLLANIVKDFETNKTGQSKYCEECKDLYILTNSIFDNYIKRITIPFNININDETNPDIKNNYKNKILYFFDLEDLKKILTSEKLRESSGDDELNKKKILCKIISVIFIKIYIIIKSIHETFNNYKPLVETETTNEDGEVIRDEEKEEVRRDEEKEEVRRDEEKEEVRRDEEKEEVRRDEEKEEVRRDEEKEEVRRDEEKEEVRRDGENEEVRKEEREEIEPSPETVPELPKTIPTLAPTLEQITNPVTNPVTNPNTNPNTNPVLNVNINANTNANTNTNANPLANPLANPEPTINVNPLANPVPTSDATSDATSNANPTSDANPTTNPTLGGSTIIDNIRGFFPFTNYEEEPPLETNVQSVKYKPTKNLFYSIFVILFTDYFELNSNNFSEKTLRETLDSISNEQFARNLAKLAKYFCDEQKEDKRHKLFELSTITKRSIIFDDSIDTLSFLNLKVDYKKEKQTNLEALKSKSGELDALLTICKDYLKTICVHIVRDPSQLSSTGETGIGETVAGETVAGETTIGETVAGETGIGEPETGEPETGEHVAREPLESNTQKEPLIGGTNNDDLFKNINYKAFAFIKTILKKMIKHYFYNRRYLYTKIIKNIVIFDKKKKLITKIDDNLTYNKILELTHKTKYKILELNYYVYKYSSVILKVFYNELNNLDKKTVALKSSNIIARALNFKTGYGGKRNKRITRKNIKHKSIRHKSRKHKRGTRKRQTS